MKNLREWVKEHRGEIGWNKGNILPPVEASKIKITPDGHIELDGERDEMIFEDLFWVIPFYGQLDSDTQANLHKWLERRLGIDMSKLENLHMGNGIIMLDLGDKVYYLSITMGVIAVDKRRR